MILNSYDWLSKSTFCRANAVFIEKYNVHILTHVEALYSKLCHLSYKYVT